VVEKPPRDPKVEKGSAVLGIYYFSPRIWDALDSTPILEKDDQLERAYQKLITNHSSGYIRYDDQAPYSGKFASYKFPWHLMDINKLLLSRVQDSNVARDAEISPLAVIDDSSGPIIIDSQAKVKEFAIIRGPAYIGKRSIIGNNVLVRGGVSIGEDCVVGFGTEVKHAVLGDGVWLHKNFVGDSIISDNCSFGAGTITGNLRFDEEKVTVKIYDNQPRVSTGTEYFGVIMAEDCRTGCNAVLSPGVKMGPNSILEAGVVLKHDLPANCIASRKKDNVEIIPSKVDIHALGEKRKAHLKK
jgi:UDP-N-acetylglucosamine diphosphorylase / glucose-1-phosphate thymidylyltransferase / UDP-N-acetylgalactosamine diphosphorylase / glucosamine-1-phosphate N-acetyltransferase / galactosamine-1-phosphate N-acetyltransferase